MLAALTLISVLVPLLFPGVGKAANLSHGTMLMRAASTLISALVPLLFPGAGVPDHPPGSGRDVLPQLRHPGAGRTDHQPGPGKHRESGLRAR